MGNTINLIGNTINIMGKWLLLIINGMPKLTCELYNF